MNKKIQSDSKSCYNGHGAILVDNCQVADYKALVQLAVSIYADLATILTVSSDIIGVRRDLLDEAGAQILEAILEFNGLCHCNTILGDLGRAIRLFDHHIPSLQDPFAASAGASFEIAGPKAL